MPAAASSSRAIVAAEDDSIRHDSMTYASGGRISHLEVVNFKSYGGTRTIGPFLGFTAVVGPNGAGKSNLMDALSFVCAVNAKDLRGKQLKDLIYRSTSDTGDEERSASVALVFQRGDKEIVFKREINSSGVGTFRIDGRKVDAKAYHDRMQAEGIMTKAHTGFLVFQGYVAELAAKSPMELTALFESISGSDAYKEDYERLDAEKKRAEDEQSYAYQKKKLLTQERTNVRKQKEEAEKYTELQEQLKEHKRRLALLRLFHIETEVQSLHEAAASCRQEADAEAAKHAELEEQVGVQEKEKAKQGRKVVELERKAVALTQQLDGKSPEQIQLQEEIGHTTKRKAMAQKSLDKLEEQRRKSDEQLATLQSELKEISVQAARLESEGEAAEAVDLAVHLLQHELVVQRDVAEEDLRDHP